MRVLAKYLLVLFFFFQSSLTTPIASGILGAVENIGEDLSRSPSVRSEVEHVGEDLSRSSSVRQDASRAASSVEGDLSRGSRSASPPRNPSPPDPANIPLPPQRGNPNPPPAGHRGVHTTDDGVTHATYGNHQTEGIPLHAQHVEYNYKKHPENNQPYPVNTASKGAKDKLRDDLIGNKPSVPGHSRDHKPPNVQDVPGDRKSKTTVQNLPTKESDKEMKLLGSARSQATHANDVGGGVIHLHPGTGRSRPPSDASLGGSVHSVDPGTKPPKKPRPPPGPPRPPPSREKPACNQRQTNKLVAAEPPAVPPVEQRSLHGMPAPVFKPLKRAKRTFLRVQDRRATLESHRPAAQKDCSRLLQQEPNQEQSNQEQLNQDHRQDQLRPALPTLLLAFHGR